MCYQQADRSKIGYLEQLDNMKSIIAKDIDYLPNEIESLLANDILDCIATENCCILSAKKRNDLDLMLHSNAVLCDIFNCMNLFTRYC